MTLRSNERRPAFLCLFGGGTGLAASGYASQLRDIDRPSSPFCFVHVDTDPVTETHVDHSILIPLGEHNAEVLLTDPASFGPVAETIVSHYPELLNPEDIGDGSRTTRLLTQLAFVFHESQVSRQLREAIIDLLHAGDFDYILPVIAASTGGGAGSALVVLLAQALAPGTFRNRLLEGLPDGILRTPIAIVVEPYAYASRHPDAHAAKIYANACGARIETAMLERQRALKYVLHIGLANAAGVVLDSPQEIARVLGTITYQFCRSWLDIKRRLVDTVDIHAHRGHYRGNDIPENYLSGDTIRSGNHDA